MIRHHLYTIMSRIQQLSWTQLTSMWKNGEKLTSLYMQLFQRGHRKETKWKCLIPMIFSWNILFLLALGIKWGQYIKNKPICFSVEFFEHLTLNIPNRLQNRETCIYDPGPADFLNRVSRLKKLCRCAWIRLPSLQKRRLSNREKIMFLYRTETTIELWHGGVELWNIPLILYPMIYYDQNCF